MIRPSRKLASGTGVRASGGNADERTATSERSQGAGRDKRAAAFDRVRGGCLCRSESWALSHALSAAPDARWDRALHGTMSHVDDRQFRAAGRASSRSPTAEAVDCVSSTSCAGALDCGIATHLIWPYLGLKTRAMETVDPAASRLGTREQCVASSRHTDRLG